MEKKKLLLVAISVGVFLTIIISASILVFSPKNSNAAGSLNTGTTVSRSRPIPAGTGASTGEVPVNAGQPASVDAAELVRNANSIQNIQTPPSAIATTETNFFINGAEPAEGLRIEKTDNGTSARVTINVPRPSTAAVPDTASRTAPASSSPASTAQTTAKPAEKPVATKPAATVAKPAAETKTYIDYWVQTGAFSAKSNAENVKEKLSSKGIASIIENRVIDGKTIYQVRVGPYTSENEAKYWLTLVQAIDGFSDSLIRQTKSVR